MVGIFVKTALAPFCLSSKRAFFCSLFRIDSAGVAVMIAASFAGAHDERIAVGTVASAGVRHCTLGALLSAAGYAKPESFNCHRVADTPANVLAGVFASWRALFIGWVPVMSAKILRLNLAGQPIEWVDWQEAVCLHARNLVAWSLGELVRTVRGGRSRITGQCSVIQVPSIIACGGGQLARPRARYPLTNPTLFARDNFFCMYCALEFPAAALTRDHVVPVSRGGSDRWENVVAACRRCNQYKANYLPEEIGMELVALPYCPNNAEYLALINSRRILGDQMEFLRSQFSRNSRLL